MKPEKIASALWGNLRKKFPELPQDLPIFFPYTGGRLLAKFSELPEGIPALSLYAEESWWYDPDTDEIFYPAGNLACRETFVWFLGHELVHRARRFLGIVLEDEDFEEIEVDALALEILPNSRVGWLWALVRWGFGDDLVREGTLTEEGEELVRLYEATKDNPLWGWNTS